MQIPFKENIQNNIDLNRWTYCDILGNNGNLFEENENATSNVNIQLVILKYLRLTSLRNY